MFAQLGSNQQHKERLREAWVVRSVMDQKPKMLSIALHDSLWADLGIRKTTFSADRRKAFLELSGMKPRHVAYVRLNNKTFTSNTGKNFWSTGGWYKGKHGII